MTLIPVQNRVLSINLSQSSPKETSKAAASPELWPIVAIGGS